MRQREVHFIFQFPSFVNGQQENEPDLHLLPQLHKSRSQVVPVLEVLALTAGPGGGSTTKWPCRKGMDPAGASPVGGIIGLSQLESHQAAAQGVGGGRGVRAWWPEPWEACPRRRLGRWRVEERRPEGRRAGRRNAWDGGAVGVACRAGFFSNGPCGACASPWSGVNVIRGPCGEVRTEPGRISPGRARHVLTYSSFF